MTSTGTTTLNERLQALRDELTDPEFLAFPALTITVDNVKEVFPR